MTLDDLERQSSSFYGFLAISDCNTSLYHSQGGTTHLSLCDPDREFGICVLTYREHPNFQLNYWTGTAIGFRASCEHFSSNFLYYLCSVVACAWRHWCLDVTVHRPMSARLHHDVLQQQSVVHDAGEFQTGSVHLLPRCLCYSMANDFPRNFAPCSWISKKTEVFGRILIITKLTVFHWCSLCMVTCE